MLAWSSAVAQITACETGAPDCSAPTIDWELLDPEPHDAGWAFQFDNDLFTPLGTDDRDYTGGAAISFGGRRARDHALSLHPALATIDRLVGVSRHHEAAAGYGGHSMQIGLVAFTPGNVASTSPQYDDRPYANLLFMANSRYSVREDFDTLFQSQFTVGVLGTPVAELLQKGIHEITQSTKPRGYSHQVSNGGEPTLRYAISRRSILHQGLAWGNRFELTSGVEASAGFLTEMSGSLSLRLGRIYSPWWTFSPAFGAYVPASQPAASDMKTLLAPPDSYFWATATIRLRAYNAFLQGQYAHSEVTFHRDELNVLIPELSVGFTTTVGGFWRLAYSMHLQANEIRHGPGARNVVWAGITLQPGQ